VRFNKEKIFLLGHSWGTQFEILTAKRYPEDYHAYIAVAQDSTSSKGGSVSYTWLKGQVGQMEGGGVKRNLIYLEHPLLKITAGIKLKDKFGLISKSRNEACQEGGIGKVLRGSYMSPLLAI